MTDCVSNVHEAPVDGTVPGTFKNPYNPDKDERTTYCEMCATTGELFGLFVREDKQASE